MAPELSYPEPAEVVLSDPVTAQAVAAWRRFPWEEIHFMALRDRSEERGVGPEVLNLLDWLHSHKWRPRSRPRSRRSRQFHLARWHSMLAAYFYGTPY